MVPSIQVQALALAIDVTSIEVDQGTLQTVESDVKINLYTAVQTTVHIHMGLKVGSKVVSRLSDNEVSYKEDCEDREYATRGSPNPKLRGHSRNDIILLQRARERHSWDLGGPASGWRGKREQHSLTLGEGEKSESDFVLNLEEIG